MIGASYMNSGKAYVRKGVSAVRQKVYNVTHFAEIEAAKPQVKLGWYHKGKDGQLVEATLSQDMLDSIPRTMKKMLYALLITGVIGSANKAKVHAENIAKIPVNIMTAKAKSVAEEVLVWDAKLPIPERLAKFVQTKGSQAEEFYNSLKNHKDSLMKDLGLTNSQYNDYAITALKIAKEESQLGLSKKYKAYEIVQNDEKGIELLSQARELVTGDGSLSLGMTRFKIANASEKEKALFEKYGITYENLESNILQPEKSAVATMIHLAELGKGYPKYLESVRGLRPDTTSVASRESLERARQILFDDMKRPGAIRTLTCVNGSKAEESTMMFEGIDAKDLEDLRFFASTVELSESAYLAARWNGKKVIPSGDAKDIACANLLNIAAQKGYVSNIDKTSKVAY